MQRQKFDWKDFLKRTAVIAIPVALQNLLTTTGSMVDTMMLAPMGELTVGSVGLCAQFSSLLFSSYWGFIGGGMLFFAQYWGAKDDDGINRSFGLTFVCMMTMALIFAGLAIFRPQWVMRLYTDKESIQQIGIHYLKIVGFAYPLTAMSVGTSALLRSTERVKVPLYASVASVCTNVFLNYVLINGRFGFPAMGERGAALATVCASMVNLAVVYLCAARIRYNYLFQIRRHFHWDVPHVREYLRKCFPIICNEMLIGVANMMINMVLGRQSEQAIAALAVFRTMEGLIIGFFAGFSNAASVLVGKCVGAGELDKAYERAKRLILLCGCSIAVVGAILMALHTRIFTLMGLRGESFTICTGITLIYCIMAIIRMCNWCMNDTYRSAGDAMTGTVLEIAFMYLLVLPCVYVTGIVLKTSFYIVFACCYSDEIIRVGIMIRHLISGRWIRPVTREGQAALPAFYEKYGKGRIRTAKR